MKDELRYALDKYKNALDSLKDGAKKAKNDLEKDGLIQRFEFTFELMWKAAKLILEEKGINASNPKDTLKEIFRQGWISEEIPALEMLEDRNKTSHTYNKTTSEAIYGRIKKSHVEFLEKVFSQLTKQV
jgi:nucleotidyltransferase substrate binding protein (TIGR01987 family)